MADESDEILGLPMDATLERCVPSALLCEADDSSIQRH